MSIPTPAGLQVPHPLEKLQNSPARPNICELGAVLQREKTLSGDFQSMRILENIAWEQDRALSFLLKVWNDKESLAPTYSLVLPQLQLQ